jgi:hypothetical protein
MGNRATVSAKKSTTAVYLHWNGGRASIDGFCLACKRLGFRSPGTDESYGSAYFTAVCALFFGDGLSVGVGKKGSFGNEDNGHYEIGKDWEVLSGSIEECSKEKTEHIAAKIVAMWKAAQAAGVQFEKDKK